MGIFIFISVFFLLVLYGIPIAFSFGIGAFFYLVFEMPDNISILASRSFSALDSFALLAIPLFIYAGDIMRVGGISKKIVDFAYIFVKKIKGGLAHVTVLASTFFGAISGSSAATVAAIGSIVIPEMTERGYIKKFAATVSSAAGILGILIPPSIPMIVYAMIANVSVARLFLAGIVPGILMAGSFIVVNFFMENKYRKEKYQRESVYKFEQRKGNPWNVVPALIMPLIILGGIYTGIFTPTEAGAIAVAYGIIIGMFFYKELNFNRLINIGKESAYTTSLIMLVISLAGVFGWIITTQRIPELLTNFVTGITENKFVILLILNLFYIILGTFLETITAIIITTPVVIPLITYLDIDLVHFGIIQTVNLSIGLITPPMALNLMVASRISGVSIKEIIKPILPYLIASFIVLQLVTYIPEISLFLPNLLLDN